MEFNSGFKGLIFSGLQMLWSKMVYRYRLHYRCVCVCVFVCAPARARCRFHSRIKCQTNNRGPYLLRVRRLENLILTAFLP